MNDIAVKFSGHSVMDYIYFENRSKMDVLDELSFSHPSIFMIEYSLAKCLMDTGIHPDIVLGNSLGSFAAAAVAGFVQPEEAMLAVLRHAAAFESTCDAGGMISILAQPDLFEEEFLSSQSECAGVNLDAHFTISALEPALRRIEDELARRDILHQRLPLRFAFHSRWIEPARAACLSFPIELRSGPARLPLMCCDRAELLSDLPEDYFWQVARQPIRMREAVAALEKTGPHHYIDLGPSGTLSTFLKYLIEPASGSTAHVTLSPYRDDFDPAALRSALQDRGGR